MNKFISIKYPIALLPAFAMGISVASAHEIKCDCPCDEARASSSAKQNHGQDKAEQSAMASARADTAKTRAKADAAKSEASRKAARAHAKADAAKAEADLIKSQYVTSQPANDYFSGGLIGQEVINRRDNEVIGTVNELLIDRTGQIGAVIVSAGGIMGLGKKDLAIAWNQVQREVNGDDITLSVNFSSDSLVDAPTFARK